MNNRKHGFFWVKQFNHEWTVAEWMEGAGFWLVPGDNEPTYESELLEIREEPIPPPKD